MFYYVYILQCNDQSYYIRCTENLEERLAAHNKGLVKSTKGKLPVNIVAYIAFREKAKAYQFEKYLKSGSGRAFRNKKANLAPIYVSIPPWHRTQTLSWKHPGRSHYHSLSGFP